MHATRCAADGWLMWKLVEADDGTLTSDDLLVVSVLLADAARRAERRGYEPVREREVWEKLQPALRAARGWVRRDGDDGYPASGRSTQHR